MKSIAMHPAPKIVPGLNLTAARFEEIYAWIRSLSADTAYAIRRPYQYGLVIPFDGKASVRLEKAGSKLTLTRCSAVTPAGSVIGIFEDIHQPLSMELREREMHPQEEYLALVEVDHSAHDAFGPESEDLPLRPLYAMPGYRLVIQAANQQMAVSTDSVCVGVLKREFAEWELVDYIPPCVHIGAHPVLKERYRTYAEEMEEMLRLFPQIIVNTDAYHEKSMVELREFTMLLGSFLAFHRHRYTHLGEGGHPFELFEFWAGFARQTSFLLQCLKDRAGFYNLLNENTRQRNGVYFTAQSWDAAIQDLANLKYQQNNLLAAVRITDQFLETIGPVFKALGYGVEQVRNRTGWVEEKRKDYTTW